MRFLFLSSPLCFLPLSVFHMFLFLFSFIRLNTRSKRDCILYWMTFALSNADYCFYAGLWQVTLRISLLETKCRYRWESIDHFSRVGFGDLNLKGDWFFHNGIEPSFNGNTNTYFDDKVISSEKQVSCCCSDKDKTSQISTDLNDPFPKNYSLSAFKWFYFGMKWGKPLPHFSKMSQNAIYFQFDRILDILQCNAPNAIYATLFLLL